MKRIFLMLFVSMFVLCSRAAFAKTPGIAKLTDLRRGEKAIGFTVFRGLYPEKFDVTLGGTQNWIGQKYILAQISGLPSGIETPLKELGGVHGMSGSPVFLASSCSTHEECVDHGKMVGAISIRPADFFTGGVNAMITPAEDMFGAHAEGFAAVAQLQPANPPLESIDLAKKLGTVNGSAMGGFSLEPCDVRAAETDLGPGSAIVIFFAKGDIPIASSGTVTWKDNDTGTIYIFGHPMNGTGNVRYPFAQIKIEGFVQTSYQPSHLPGCVAGNEGTITVDGPSEVSGVVGKVMSLVNFDFTLRVNPEVFRLHEEIVMKTPLTAALFSQLPQARAGMHVGFPKNVSIDYTVRIVLKNEPEIFIKNTLPYNGAAAPAGVIAQVLTALETSGFEYMLESIEIHASIEQKPTVWKKSAAFITPAEASPCETVKLSIALAKFPERAPAAVTEIPISIPCNMFGNKAQPSTAPQKTRPTAVPFPAAPETEQILISVQSGMQFKDLRANENPRTLKEFIERTNELASLRSDGVYIQIVYPPQKNTADVKSPSTGNPPTPLQAGAGGWVRVDNPESIKLLMPEQPKPTVVVLKLPPLPDIVNIDEHLVLNIKSSPMPPEPGESTAQRKKKRFFFF